MEADLGDLSLADVESAKPSAAFMANIIIDKKAPAAEGSEAQRRCRHGRPGAHAPAGRCLGVG